MKIKCPHCKGTACLSFDFSYVKCKYCGLDVSYAEYVKIIAYGNFMYSDILRDYRNSNTLDEWKE